MTRRSVRAIVACILLSLIALEANGESGGSTATAAVPFGEGEKLTFAIRYGFIKAGVATMGIDGIVEHNGRQCYHIVSEARSTMPFSLFFEVKDRVESLMDVEGLYTWRYEKKLKEGNYHAHDVVVFDQEGHTATYSNGKVIAVPERVQDVLTSLYYVRTMELAVGKDIYIDNHAGGKNYPLEVKVLRTEKVTVPAGTFECFVVEPILKAAGIFQHKGRLTVWLARGPGRVPVMMKSKVIIGSIEAILIEAIMSDQSGE
jgi:hypothetical protein